MELKKPLQALLISPDKKSRERILSEEQNTTIIKGWRTYQKGYAVLCCPIEPWCVGAEIDSIRYTRTKKVTKNEYNKMGYASHKDMVEDLKNFYPNINLESPVTVISWKNITGKLVEEYKHSKNVKRILKEIEDKSKGTGLEIKV